MQTLARHQLLVVVCSVAIILQVEAKIDPDEILKDPILVRALLQLHQDGQLKASDLGFPISKLYEAYVGGAREERRTSGDAVIRFKKNVDTLLRFGKRGLQPFVAGGYPGYGVRFFAPNLREDTALRFG